MTHSPTTQRLTWRSFGPGILMASAAIGGSHLVASTQAGALYGWQLAIMIVLANLAKYPFYRFATEYTYSTGTSLVAGYAKISRVYLWAFFVLCIISGVISTGAVALLCAVILGQILPWELSTLALSAIVMASSWLLLFAGHYKLLDSLTKWIIVCLTMATLAAVCIAAGKPANIATDFIPASPWNLAALGFIIALMGWMPAPLEFSAITSVWTAKKIRTDHTTRYQGMVDFNVGYFTSAILALFFLALGVFVQYGTGQEIAMQGGAYVPQLIQMYTQTIGEWSRLLVAFIAFLCMYGTVITCADGYGRTNAESLSLLLSNSTEHTEKYVSRWVAFTIVAGFGLIAFFSGQMATLLKFAMISAFVTAPIFAYLNYALVKKEGHLSTGMKWFALAGIAFLAGFTLLFLLQFFGIIGS
ncbi:NRAMP family divalent metal transporter [Moraxella cuniculi]|uniref:Mn2+ and Fe2+ transporters of the NRAMP family n=1 Tax=Moraxella cuniculi TaxID=34061 RepID=A0A448GXX5_9GAMM|nr:divalent metal cation transporter [Moraxella cuniculi]VEG13666.1 Mn2+ and Fe2+ transporters of the NRAMP family [Moraxella cuniculi]